MYSLIIFMVILSAFSQILLLCTCDNSLSKKWYVPVKMIASTCFLICLVLAMLNKASENVTYVDLIILVAFVFCFMGDLFIGKYNQKRKRRYMIVGIIVFALGHVFFLASLYMLNLQLNIVVALLPLLFVALLALIIRCVRLHVGRLFVSVLVYSFFVSSLLVKSVYNAFVLGDTSSLLMGAGGILFFVSDFLIIFLYFYKFKAMSAKRIVHSFNLVTYFCAMLAFAISVLFR